jgi:probable HAF family extracellular repeat protein
LDDSSTDRHQEIMVPRLMSGIAWKVGSILAILLGLAVPSRAGFTIRDLGVLTPSGTSAGAAINPLGNVAGSATNAAGVSEAVKTQGSTFQAISNTLGVSSSASSINLYGNVAGTYVDANGVNHGFSTSGGGVVTINPLTGGTYTQANGINKSGEVVGTGDVTNGTTRAFTVGSGGTPSMINPLGTGTFNQGNGINDSGSVVGTSQIAPGGPVHAFIATPSGGATDLLNRNSSGNFSYNTYGMAIANNGDVAGYGDVGRYEHAFYAPSGGGPLIDLGVLPGGSSSLAYGLNDMAQVVGAVSYGSIQPGQASSQAFIWDSIDGMFNLNLLISLNDQANWVLTEATGINDNDQITGVGLLDGVEHGFLLTPIPGEPLFSAPGVVPEPPTSVLVTFGLAIVALYRWLRPGRTGGQAVA